MGSKETVQTPFCGPILLLTMAENIIESPTLPPDFVKIEKEAIYTRLLRACEERLDSVIMVRLN